MMEDLIGQIHNESCLDTMARLPNVSVDVILTDLPYGTTSNKWDVAFDLESWWAEATRICTGAIITTASQPFTAKMIMSNLPLFRHEWIWQKNAGSNFANTVREPMKEHESVLVFAVSKWTYNPQMQERSASGASRVQTPVRFETGSDNYRQFDRIETKTMPTLRVPSSVQKFNRERGLHPTQKPLALMEYLVRTYSNDNDLIYDSCCGSGTALVAAQKLQRRWIGSETSTEYVNVANTRLEPYLNQSSLFGI